MKRGRPPAGGDPAEVVGEPALITAGTSVRVLLVADVRSPTTWNWVESIRSADVTVLGPDGQPWPDRRAMPAHGKSSRPRVTRWVRSLATATPQRLRAAQKCRRALRPPLAWIKGRRLRRVIASARPDVVHALRIPYESMTALAACPDGVPLAVSIWGNDLTLHARESRITGWATRKVLTRADMLFADCQRDIDLARRWGLRPNRPTALLPGGGGIRLARPGRAEPGPGPYLGDFCGPDGRLILNARGCREYVRNDILIEALSLLAPDLSPHVRLIFADAAHDKSVRRGLERYPLAGQTMVLGRCSSAEMLSLFSRAEIYVSVTAHDGTPNSLLEAMAAGAIPVCGDLPSIREWITHGSNGFLARFDDPHAVAASLRLALELPAAERAAIRAANRQIIAARAEQGATGRHAAEQYRRLTRGAAARRGTTARRGHGTPAARR